MRRLLLPVCLLLLSAGAVSAAPILHVSAAIATSPIYPTTRVHVSLTIDVDVSSPESVSFVTANDLSVGGVTGLTQPGYLALHLFFHHDPIYGRTLAPGESAIVDLGWYRPFPVAAVGTYSGSVLQLLVAGERFNGVVVPDFTVITNPNPASVPEPASLSLIGLGLMPVFRRRRH